MEEDRKQTDARMDSMEKDIREIRNDQKELQRGVSEIREKIFNGFSHAIEESRDNSKEIKKTVEKLNLIVSEMHSTVYRTPEEVLASCPFKKEVVDMLKKKINWWLLVSIFILIITNNLKEIWLVIKAAMGVA